MNSLEIVPSVLDRIRKTPVGLKMPRALEVVVSENNRPRDARTSRSASDPRQLRHPQDAGREALVDATQTLHTALHADILFLAQPRRAALRRNHSPAHPTRNLQRRHRTQVDRASKPK